MKKSPIFPKSKSEYGDDDGFDPHMDFSVFLEEAKQHTSQSKLRASTPPRNYAGETAMADEKNKKWWKNILLFWSKSKKKVKPHNEIFVGERQDGAQVWNMRRRAVSGPIYASNEQVGTTGSSRSISGPLAAFLTPRREEFEVPYACLDQFNHRKNGQAFGPIYLVT